MLEIQSNRSPGALNILKFAHKASRDWGKNSIPKPHGHEYNFFDYTSQSGPEKFFEMVLKGRKLQSENIFLNDLSTISRSL